MALCRTGAHIFNYTKFVLVNPCFIVPSSVNFQVRHAARKGYRDKAKRAKKDAAKDSPVVTKEIRIIKRKFTKVEKTVDLKKPEPPADDVILLDLFNYKKYSLSEAVTFHREYHHPTVYNNPNAPVSLKIEINMTGKSQFQFIKPFSGVAPVPHPFSISQKKDVLVLCSPEDTELALSCGASLAGGVDIVKKIQEGEIQPSLYSYVIAHVNFLPHLTPIRALLKDKLPRVKIGTLTSDLKSAIYKFLYGIEYSCVQIGASKNFGLIVCNVGTIKMELNHLEENLRTLIADIEKNKPPRDGDFITWIWCGSPPSKEAFSLDLGQYIETKKMSNDDDDENDQEGSTEKEAAKALLDEYKEKTLMSGKA